MCGYLQQSDTDRRDYPVEAHVMSTGGELHMRGAGQTVALTPE